MIASWHITQSFQIRKPVIQNTWDGSLLRQNSSTQEKENRSWVAHFTTYKKIANLQLQMQIATSLCQVAQGIMSSAIAVSFINSSSIHKSSRNQPGLLQYQISYTDHRKHDCAARCLNVHKARGPPFPILQFHYHL